MILTVTLNPAVDRTMVPEEFSLGKINRIKRSSVRAGGKGINAARVLKLLGAEVTATGMLGGRLGEVLRECLEEEGICHEFIEIQSQTRQNVTIAGSEGGAETHFVERGPTIVGSEAGEFMEKFDAILERGGIDCAVFSGSAPPGMPEDIYGILIEKCRGKKVKTALDTSGRPLRRALKARPDVLKPNEAELGEISGKAERTDEEIISASSSLGLPEVLVTMGERGALLTSGAGIWKAVPPKVSAANTVGLGDALLAGYIFSRIVAGDGHDEAIRLGTACALARCFSPAAGSIDSGKIDELKQQITVQRLR